MKGGLSAHQSNGLILSWSAVTPLQLCGVPIADVYVSRPKRFPTAIAGHSSRTCQWWPGRFWDVFFERFSHCQSGKPFLVPLSCRDDAYWEIFSDSNAVQLAMFLVFILPLFLPVVIRNTCTIYTNIIKPTCMPLYTLRTHPHILYTRQATHGNTWRGV